MMFLVAAMALQTALSPSLEKRMDSTIAKLQHQPGFVGCEVAVSRGNRLVYVKSAGLASRGTHRKVANSDRFSIGSITKQFTSACILKLAEDGKLALDDPLVKYIPSVTNSDRMTLRQLMQHVAGLPDYYPLEYMKEEMTRPTTGALILEKYGRMPLDFEPGTRWSYSNTNYTALGEVIEKVSGMPIAQFMRERLFRPLGLAHTSFEAHPQKATGIAQGYASLGIDPLYPTDGEGDNWCGAAGAIVTTAEDLAKWDIALASGAALSKDSLAQMTTTARLKSGVRTTYGCGLHVGYSKKARFWEHGGGTMGFVSENLVLPDKGIAVVVLTNSTQTSPEDTAWEITSGLTGGAQSKPDPEPKAAAPTRPVPRVTGLKADAAARRLLGALPHGRVDRSRLTSDFNAYLSERKLKLVASHLRKCGPLGAIKLKSTVERGGMEVAVFSIEFGGKARDAYMYREPNGRIAELYIIQ